MRLWEAPKDVGKCRISWLCGMLAKERKMPATVGYPLCIVSCAYALATVQWPNTAFSTRSMT